MGGFFEMGDVFGFGRGCFSGTEAGACEKFHKVLASFWDFSQCAGRFTQK